MNLTSYTASSVDPNRAITVPHDKLIIKDRLAAWLM
jgi:hypothetical protein